MRSRGHETIDHTADMGIRGWGATPAEAFEETAAAMFELMVDRRGLEPARMVTIRREAADLTELLVEFLNGLLAEADLSETVFLDVAVKRLEKVGTRWVIEAAAGGISRGAAGEALRVEVKAATYYGASVVESGRGVWSARCVVDL